MDRKKLEKLYERGRKLLNEGKIEEAKEKFYEFLQYEDNVFGRNNLALALFLSGDLSGALSILEPVLSGEKDCLEPNPYTFALASMIYGACGNELQARQYLKQAVEKFDRQLLLYSPSNVPLFFREYALVIMKAAGKLKDHRRVYELYRRWKDLHVSWEADYLAAVACFNMGDYQKAAKLWEKTKETLPAADSMSQIAMLVYRGEVPRFEMEYERITEKELDEMFHQAIKNEEARRKFMEKGFFKMAALAMLLSQDDDYAGNWLGEIINYGGSWGEELGRRILKSYFYPTAIKTAAAGALVEKGVFRPGEPIPAVIDGRKTYIEIKKQEIVMERDEKLDEIVSKALHLRDEGKLDKAIKLLEELIKKDKFYPPAAINLANFYRLKGEYEKALGLYKILEKIAGDDPVFLFNYSALMMEMGNIDKAWEYFERIKKDANLGEEFNKKLELLERWINLHRISHEDIMRYWQESMREDVEQKAIPVDVTLAKGIKNMPAQWLEGACRAYGLEPARRRRDREKQLCDFLLRRENLEKAVRQLGRKERELLKYLLQHDGWSRLNAVTRKFGSMDGDGYFWAEKPPESPLGILWSRALVMVGKAKLEGRNYKIATIPVELRQPLCEILSF